ncbi:hypothetical protein [Streptomyces sp. NPDC050548]
MSRTAPFHRLDERAAAIGRHLRQGREPKGNGHRRLSVLFGQLW